MALVVNICKSIEIPHEPGEHAVIRRLSWKQLKAAAKAHSLEGTVYMKAIGGEIIAALNAGDSSKLQRVQAEFEANLQNYDRETLLTFGVASWSYEKTPSDGLNDLDETTAAFLAQEIFTYSRPPSAEEAKND